MRTYDLGGYELTEKQFSAIDSALAAMCDLGLSEEVRMETQDVGILMSCEDTETIENIDMSLGELLGMLIVQTGDVPYHIIRRVEDGQYRYYILMIPSGLPESNFGEERAGIGNTYMGLAGGGEVCAISAPESNGLRPDRTSIVHIDCSTPWCVRIVG